MLSKSSCGRGEQPLSSYQDMCAHFLGWQVPWVKGPVVGVKGLLSPLSSLPASLFSLEGTSLCPAAQPPGDVPSFPLPHPRLLHAVEPQEELWSSPLLLSDMVLMRALSVMAVGTRAACLALCLPEECRGPRTTLSRPGFCCHLCFLCRVSASSPATTRMSPLQGSGLGAEGAQWGWVTAGEGICVESRQKCQKSGGDAEGKDEVWLRQSAS